MAANGSGSGGLGLGLGSGGLGAHSHADKRKLVIACIACRKKKVKCSGDRPACANCLRLNVPCQYPAVKNRGSRFGYKEMLTKRLEMMERHIRPPSSAAARAILDEPLGESKKRTADGTLKSLGYSAAADDAASDLMQSLSREPPHGLMPNKITIRGPGGMPVSAHSDSTRSEEDSPSSAAALARAQTHIEVHMPDFDTINHLTELYFHYLHNQSYAFLHKPTFVPRLRAGQVNPLLVLAVCAVSARFSKHPDIMTAPRYVAQEPFIAEARRLLSHEFDEPTVETTQALLIMGFNDFVSLNGGRAAIYSGLSMRMASTLGLNKETPDDPQLSWVDREIRRKTWWSVLVLDRLVHAGPKRSFLLMEEECQIQLPSSDHAFLNATPVVTELLSG
ncbi:fungal-specific transcription factor domain-containing protein, partial [Dipodascopsis tothii]|uniref:fungal-specific transcription factor domain-containing protein n=1 Tax=Dipodascopsis tothii TaxID=44089 RepID=UPI0034CF2C94